MLGAWMSPSHDDARLTGLLGNLQPPRSRRYAELRQAAGSAQQLSMPGFWKPRTTWGPRLSVWAAWQRKERPRGHYPPSFEFDTSMEPE